MKDAKNVTLCAIMISLAMVLSYIEKFIPLQLLVPLPGIKLGLANVVTMMALYFFGMKEAFTILILRCILGSAFGGGLSGLAFSLTGGLLAMTTMSISSRIRGLSVYGVSVLGSAAHCIGQVAVARVLMGSVYVTGYLSYLLAVSVFTGLATGTACAGAFRGLALSGQMPEKKTKISSVHLTEVKG